MEIVFWITAFVVIASAVGVVTMTNLIHSALLLALTMFGVAVLFVILAADFLAAVQVLVYVGAVMALVVFGVMILQRGPMNLSNMPSKHVLGGLFAAIATMGFLFWGLGSTEWPVSEAAPAATTVEPIAELLFTKYVVAFEVAGVLLTVAAIGAIILAKEVRAGD